MTAIKHYIALLLTTLFFLHMDSFSQSAIKNYDKEWKNVEVLVSKGQPQSALAEVKKIYALAKKDKQDAQLIKSLIYTSELQNDTREKNVSLSIAELEKEITESSQPVISILQNILARTYWQYMQANRYKIYNRTKTSGFKKADIDTWGMEDYHNTIRNYFLKSLLNETLLQNIKLEAYDAIIEKGNSRNLRPSLYDLLAHHALDYFINDESGLGKPSYAYQMDDETTFAPATDFIAKKNTAKDSTAQEIAALHIYQKLITQHIADGKEAALVDVDLERLNYVHNKSVHAEKDDLYIKALEHIRSHYPTLPQAAQASFLIAQEYYNKGVNYKPYGDTLNRYAIVKAKEICEKILLQKEKSEGRANCFNLLQTIQEHALHVELEKVNLPDLPFRSLVTYKNIGTLYMRIIKADAELKEKMANQYNSNYWEQITAAKTVKSWQQSLPVTNDYQSHKVEIKIDALPMGEYFFVVSTNESFDLKKSIIGARAFHVSNISYINSGKDYFVLDRNSGKPLAGAAVQVYRQSYDYNNGKNTVLKDKAFTTDGNGHFIFAPANDKNGSNNYRFEIIYKNDKLFLDDWIYDYISNINPDAIKIKTQKHIFLFTDRSIYRPGQKVYYKGIVVEKDLAIKGKTSVVPGFKTTMQLIDANGEKKDSTKVTTNDFGSFSGSFTLPTTGLTGQFSILANLNAKDNIQNNAVTIRVEEYKRPKFYVEFDTVKETYKVNDKVIARGHAKAYAGNTIDGATVTYQVERQGRYLNPWMYYRGWWPQIDPQEIAHGTVKTNELGLFEIPFQAIPDRSIENKTGIIFTYNVHVDITDINGETRSGEQGIDISYQSLFIESNIPAKLDIQSLEKLSIRTQNVNRAFVEAPVTVKFFKLKEEKRLIRNRYWDRPDQFILPKNEYVSLFPNDEYDNESDYTSWEVIGTPINKTNTTRADYAFDIKGIGLSTGYYKIELETKDKNGELIKDVHFVEVYNPLQAGLQSQQYLWAQGGTGIEPGQKTTVSIGSSATDVYVIQQTNKVALEGNRTFSYLTLNNEIKRVDVVADETDRGGYSLSWAFVKNNRIFNYTQFINVPWSNKQLKTEFVTFRNKTLPGSEEKWTLKISGPGSDHAAAEVLATMYDASLDQFYQQPWNNFYQLFQSYGNTYNWTGDVNFSKIESIESDRRERVYENFEKQYDQLKGINGYDGGGYYGEARSFAKMEGIASAPMAAMEAKQDMAQKDVVVGSMKQMRKVEKKENQQQTNVQVRKNFNETAFFFPHLVTDTAGHVSFSFTMPEALTTWKFRSFAHTKQAAYGTLEQQIITQKKLMVQPFAPRFLREGDKIDFTAKVVNLTDKEVTGLATLELFDAATNEPIDQQFQHTIPGQYFTIGAGQSGVVTFPLTVPYRFNSSLTWRIIAANNPGAGEEKVSDGEENNLPVLSNRMLVTETMPLPMRGTGVKEFTFAKLLKSGSSETLQHQSITLEYTSNPAWYAIQALPYLMEYPYECAEQTWNRYYANALAHSIIRNKPGVKLIFDKWATIDTAALLSNLQKNQELKSILLEETPWVLAAKTEAEQKKNIALLFDMVRMSQQLTTTYNKLAQMQSPNGGFVWFTGGPDDRYMTQYIITGLGHLIKLNALEKEQAAMWKPIIDKAIPYLDNKIKQDYTDLKKYKTNLSKYTPGYTQIQYLYMRSFFTEYGMSADVKTVFNYFKLRTQKTWLQQNKYMQAMIALILSRNNVSKTPKAILKSLKETSINNPELGMYWKDNRRGWFWYEAPIERQAMMIEAFNEVAKDQPTVDDLRTWLIKNKQTNKWESTKATAEACYALLLQGTEWLTSQPLVTISLGNTGITNAAQEQQPGTGYFSTIIPGSEVRSSMGNISVSVQNPATVSTTKPVTIPSWGAVYWQYFENLDKITFASTPLHINKKLFVEKNTDRGPVLNPVEEGSSIKIGDKVKVRIEIKVDRDMEYVHMKDMRASSLEPVNVLSSYKWQGGLGYYEATKDASTNFFFNYLPMGTYVFEYALFATHAGDFSNGITTIQCMYAPEFTSHSEGVRIKVED